LNDQATQTKPETVEPSSDRRSGSILCSSASIRAVAPWFGGKRTIADDIVKEIGKHQAYWEPFCGSMAVLLAKPTCSMETVNDLNADLINLARCLQDRSNGPALYRRLRRRLAAQDELLDARQQLYSGTCEIPDIDRAEAYFVHSWLSMNGTAGTRAGIDNRRGVSRRFSSNGGAPAIRFAGAIDSIPAWRRRLRNVFILRDDGIELCERCEDKDGTVIYADPPYIAKGEEYIHDFAEDDHERLAAALRKFRRTRVLVSYYEHDRLAELYPGWTVKPISTTKMMQNQGMRDKTGSVKAPEVLLINGPSLEQQRGLF